MICIGYRISDEGAGTVDQVIGDTAFVTWIELSKGDPLMNIMVRKSVLQLFTSVLWIGKTISLQLLDVEKTQRCKLHDFVLPNNEVLNEIKHSNECLQMCSCLTTLLCINRGTVRSLGCF